MITRNIFNERELESNLKDFFEIGRQDRRQDRRPARRAKRGNRDWFGVEVWPFEGLKLLERVNNISLVEKLEAIKEAVKIAKSIEEIEKLL